MKPSDAKDLIAEFKINRAKEKLSDSKFKEMFGEFEDEGFQLVQKFVPLYKSVGAGYAQIEDEIEGYFPLMPDITANPDFLFTARVKGDSMEDTIKEGEIVFIDTQDKNIVNGEIYALRYNGDKATVKRVKKFESHIELIPENKKYDTQIITAEHKDEFEIIGKVLGGYRGF